MAVTVTVYNNILKELADGTINFGGLSGSNSEYKVMLVAPSSTYSVSKAHTTLSNFTGSGGVEVAAGSGYSAGGANIPTITVTVDNATNRANIAMATTTWPASTISAKGAVIYKNTGSKLVAYIDFGATVSSSNNTFTVTFVDPLKLQN